MTLPLNPTLFLAHGKARNTQTQSQPCQELKMQTHSPLTPADGILMSFTSNTSKTLFIEQLLDDFSLRIKCSIYCTTYVLIA